METMGTIGTYEMITETEDMIISRIGISPELYAELMFDSGCFWLEELKNDVMQRFPENTDRLEKMFYQVERHPLFWRWWTLEWQAADRAFLRSTEKSKHSYFTRQVNARRDMPNNVSLQLLKHAARQRMADAEAEPAATETGRTDRPVTKRV
jgi:hypothetical protein